MTLAWDSEISPASWEEIYVQLLQQTQGVSKATAKGRKGRKFSLRNKMKPSGRAVS